jgi:hypothetical protein
MLGLAAYVAQLWAQRLMAPWYVPASATLGAALLVAALVRRPTVLRGLALLLLTLLAAAEWVMLLGMRLPAYGGPVAEGQPFPAFTTARADGSTFTRDDLAGGQKTVLVFFRGRW